MVTQLFMTNTTVEMISNGSNLKKLAKESDQDYMKRITHCQLSNRGLTNLNSFELCSSLSILYLYDNNLADVSGLECLHGLSRLFLQNNQIKRIEGFNTLVNLKYLNLRGNMIQHVDGLQNCKSLEVLHLDKQRLHNQPMIFDEECMSSLAECLKLLTCTLNSIKKIDPLGHLSQLEELDISDNLMDNAEDVCQIVGQMNELRTIMVKCATLKDRYLRQKLIRACPSLTCINEKDVTDVERIFTTKLGKLRKVVKPVVDEPAKVTKRPIPHLPPYATQYRDMFLQQMQNQ